MSSLRRFSTAVLRVGVLLVLLTLLPVSHATAAVKTSYGPTVTSSPGSGAAGSVTTVTGRGFPARSSGTVTLSTAALAVRTDGKGTFTTAVTVPTAAAGSRPGHRDRGDQDGVHHLPRHCAAAR
jgi:hypothetical protein